MQTNTSALSTRIDFSLEVLLFLSKNLSLHSMHLRSSTDGHTSSISSDLVQSNMDSSDEEFVPGREKRPRTSKRLKKVDPGHRRRSRTARHQPISWHDGNVSGLTELREAGKKHRENAAVSFSYQSWFLRF